MRGGEPHCPKCGRWCHRGLSFASSGNLFHRTIPCESCVCSRCLLPVKPVRDRTAGEMLRDEGTAAVREAQDRDDLGEWNEAASKVLVRLALSGRPFTAEDLREFVGDPPRANAMGALFLKHRKVLQLVGWVKPLRPSGHASMIRQYVGKPTA